MDVEREVSRSVPHLLSTNDALVVAQALAVPGLMEVDGSVLAHDDILADEQCFEE
jgi:hypothetical protein